MYLYLNNNETKEEQKIKINDFLTMIGIELFKKCQEKQFLSRADKENITMNLCIAYVKSTRTKYFKKITNGVVKMDVDHLMINSVIELARKLHSEQNAIAVN